jgi:endoglucanase
VQVEGAGAQPTLYLDDVALIATSTRVFGDGFEAQAAAPLPSFAIDDVSAVEGNAGTQAFVFTVTRSGGLSGTDSVQVQSVDGSAQAGSDYLALAQTTLAFAPNVATRTVSITVNGDTVFEPDETFLLNLSSASNGSIADAQGVGTIVNDDAAPVPGQLRFAAATTSAPEDGGSAAIVVQRVGGSGGAVSVVVTTSDGSAVAPGDYAATTSTLNWTDGDSADKTLMVPLVADAVPETDETVGIALSAPGGGATLASPSTATLTIVEPELLFAPQFTTGSIRVYRRGVAGFALANTAALPANTNPNAVAFAPDGKLWVVDGGNPNRLLRYAAQAVATQAAPAPEAVVTPGGNALGDYFDIAFFGDSAYVSQSDFGATHRVVKLPLASLSASGSPVPTMLSNASLALPAGLAFDPQGRLWVSNVNGQTLVRMNTTTGNADRVGNSVNLGARASMSNPEGLAFDAAGTLWVGNNGAPTLAGYGAAQLDSAGFNAIAPQHFVDVEPGVTAPGDMHTGFVGGVAFDRDGDLWANYQRAFALIEYEDAAAGVPGQTLSNATTDPGFGGIAFWPVPSTVHRGIPGAGPASFRGTTLVGMEAPFTAFSAVTGPVQDTHYPRFDEKLVDYFAGKGMTALRILVGWEALQPELMGPMPGAATNYQTYFNNYVRIVDYATNVKGMTVLVAPWQFDDNVNGQGFGGIGGPTWRGGRVGTEVPMAAWSDFWSRLAGHFKDNPRVQYVLVTEPNNMSTMQWFAIAQAGITAIRSAGSTQRIHVPGNGYSAASTWNIDNAFYDTAGVKRSNAYGWLNANGPGQPLADPLNNIAVEVHSYVDSDQGGVTDEITSVTALRAQLANTVDWARANSLRVYLGETGMHATTPVNAGGTAQQAWDDFIAYFEANADTLEGFTWWAGGDPRGWWTDQGANGGGHYAISPLRPNSYVDPDTSYSGDTVNMDMIEKDF